MSYAFKLAETKEKMSYKGNSTGPSSPGHPANTVFSKCSWSLELLITAHGFTGNSASQTTMGTPKWLREKNQFNVLVGACQLTQAQSILGRGSLN